MLSYHHLAQQQASLSDGGTCSVQCTGRSKTTHIERGTRCAGTLMAWLRCFIAVRTDWERSGDTC